VRVEHVAYTPVHGKKGPVHIRRIERWGERAHVVVRFEEADADGDTLAGRQAVFERIDNVRALTITGGILLARVLGSDGAILWKQPEDFAPQSPDLFLRFGAPPATGGPFKDILCGPFRDAMNAPFICVLGTGGAPEEQARNRANLDRFRADWKTFAHGEAVWMTDADFLAALETPDPNRVFKGSPHPRGDHGDMVMLDRGHALCFGNPTTNAYLARIADRLPFRFLGDGYGVGDREVRGEKLGFAGLYPDPERASRYVAIFDGLAYGEAVSFNHKWDLIPDYLVYEPFTDSWDRTNAPRLAGFFDSDWTFDPALAETFDPPAVPETPAVRENAVAASEYEDVDPVGALSPESPTPSY
jgi:hypothetical protein